MTKPDKSANVRPFPRDVEDKESVSPSTAEAPVPEIAPAAVPQPAPAPVAAKPKRGGIRKVIAPVLGLCVLAAAGWFGYNWYITGRFMVSTDDAYVGADITTISPKVMGYVETVNVAANQQVKAGDVLITLDDGDYAIALQQAEAQIATQNLTLKRIDAQVVGGRAAVTQAEAQKTALEAAQRNASVAAERAQQLSNTNIGSKATLDAANAALDQANANLAAADAQIAAAEANIAVLEGQRAEANSVITSLELTRDKAARDQSFATLRAPFDGIVGNLAVQKGDLVAVGARLAALVPSDALYVDANFKETQLSQLVVGEKVEIRVDALDTHPIIGTIESLAPASGSVFSLLPAENATGNFTKVVQRVPVRIALPADALATGKLRAGLSVVVDADTRTIPTDKTN